MNLSYSDLKGHSEELHDSYKNIKEIFDNIIQIREQISKSESWVGPGSTNYLNKITSITNNFEEVYFELEKSSLYIDKVLEDYERLVESASKGISEIVGYGTNINTKADFNGNNAIEVHELLVFIEISNLEEAAQTIKKLDAQTIIYLKNNLEATLRHELATKYQIKELYDERTDGIINYVNNDLVNNIKNQFSEYVSSDRIDAIDETYKLLNDERFKEQVNTEGVMAYNNGKESVINLSYEDGIIKANISHEAIHGLASNDYLGSDGQIHTARGFSIDEQNAGFNECATEYLNELVMQENYPSDSYSGYSSGVSRLEKLVDSGILNQESLTKSYFNNDIGYIENTITQIGGKEIYNDLMTNFDNAISGNAEMSKQALENIDSIISNLVLLKEVK